MGDFEGLPVGIIVGDDDGDRVGGPVVGDEV